ncbi:hypothetical protein [Litoribacillus peritrichatus]|uniref:Uncharacterized protein n=1 Tax=Litoribacillus peritrichatus TaxID=718191 RepID=A0ABP7ME02_9GAMM
MISTFKYLMVFLLGLFIGIFVVWQDSYQFRAHDLEQHELLEKVLANSNTAILEENYACEGRPVRTVGAVMASLIESNKTNIRNELTYGCFESTCTISISDCKPWQDQECSTRFLKFNVNDQKTIQTETFSCIDMP